VHYHFIREKILAREIDLIHINTKYQVPNIFTKPLHTYKLKKFLKMFGIIEMDLNLRGNVENSSSIS
jgi:hypothetical protein